MERLQDMKVLPDYLQPAGMVSIHGGLAGLGQDALLYQDAQLAADQVATDPSIQTVFTAAPDPSAGYVVSTTDPAQAAIPFGASYDAANGQITIDGITYDLPGGTSALDPGLRQIGASWWWVYASGDKSDIQTGTYVWADGTYMTPDGYQIKPGAGGYSMAPDGTVTWATVATPAPVATTAAGVTGASIFGWLKGVLSAFTGPTAPAGTQPGQVFRAPNGQYYRLNADGSTSAVASPLSGGFSLAGLTSSPLLLVGVGVVAYLLLTKKKG